MTSYRNWRKVKPGNLTRGERVVAFIEKYCLVPEGSKVGQPLVLDPFQIRFIIDVYDNPHGTSRGILSMARKNGKTALIAAILLAHIVGPEAVQNAQVVSGALSRDQAALVFNLAFKMLKLNPAFSGKYSATLSGKRIVGLAKNTEYRALAADGTTAHGLSPLLAVLDETGQVRGPTTPFIEAITTSQGAHEKPLLMVISTQAASDADCLSLWIDDALRSGDPHTVCHLYAADKDADLMDPAQWRKANPALGSFRSETDLSNQLTKASRIPALENSARNLLLNQRISMESLWLAPSVWKMCSGLPDMDLFRDGRPVAAGLDLSQRNDLTALALSVEGDDGELHLLPFVFAPETGMTERELRDRAPYTAWVRSGDLIAVPGATVDYEWVFDWLRGKLDDLGIRVDVVAFDRWRITQAKADADRIGFTAGEWQEVGQGYKDMSPRIEFFETLLLQGKIRHGAHPLLNMSAANAIVLQDPSGNRKIDKRKSTQRIDPLVAAVMSAGVFMVSPGQFDAMAMIA